MSNNENEPEVKDIERVEVTPAGDDEETVEAPDSSQEQETEEGKDDKKPDTDEAAEDEEAPEGEAEKPAATKPAQENAAPTDDQDEDGQIKRVPGETPREFALRSEINRLKTDARKGRSQEIFSAPPAPAKTELSTERKKVLEQYKPEDVAKLREVFDVMAEDMGFVKKDQLAATAVQERQSEVLDRFLEKHPEYLPQNDPGNVLWDRFKGEFGLYKTPANPKDLKRVLDKVHKEVFGIKPAAALNTQAAAKERAKVASHGSSSRPKPSQEGVRRASAPTQGLRTDMLKGFSEEEIAELTGQE